MSHPSFGRRAKCEVTYAEFENMVSLHSSEVDRYKKHDDVESFIRDNIGFLGSLCAITKRVATQSLAKAVSTKSSLSNAKSREYAKEIASAVQFVLGKSKGMSSGARLSSHVKQLCSKLMAQDPKVTLPVASKGPTDILKMYEGEDPQPPCKRRLAEKTSCDSVLSISPSVDSPCGAAGPSKAAAPAAAVDLTKPTPVKDRLGSSMLSPPLICRRGKPKINFRKKEEDDEEQGLPEPCHPPPFPLAWEVSWSTIDCCTLPHVLLVQEEEEQEQEEGEQEEEEEGEK